MATCLDYALKYISIYPKTEKELEVKLHTKKYTQNDISYTMDFLKKKWYIDDLQFARLYIQSELAKKGKLPYLVKQKLLHKWVDRDIINQCMESADTEIKEGVKQRILKEVEKLKKKGLDWYDIVVKISQKGYSIRDIKQALTSKDK